MPNILYLLAACVVMLPLADLTFLGLADEWSERFATAGAPLSLLRRPRGRPRKFMEPSRTLTLTLPESVLSALAAIHADISTAIVRLVGREGHRTKRKAADLLVFGQRAVITIRPTPSLELRAGVQLVPLPDGRALISLDEPASLSALQLSLSDALEDPEMDAADRAVYENLRNILRDARRSSNVSLQQRQIIVLEARRTRRDRHGNGRSKDKRAARKVHKLRE